MIKLKGYIFSRPFLGERVPQHIQNIVLKDYCNKKKIDFFMSATEYSSRNSTYILFELLNSLKNCDGILFYSFLQLPVEKKNRERFFKNIFQKKKIVHFAVENIQVNNSFDFKFVEDMFLLKLKNFKEIHDINFIGKEKFYVNFRHQTSKRNYLERMLDDKVKCMRIAKKYGKDYWDGDRRYGYGGYKYIKNYYTFLAKNLIKDYNLTKNSKILDIGCGKGYLVYELSKLLKSKNVFGCDVSKYALKNSKKEITKQLFFHDIKKVFKFKDNNFDFVFSNTTLHNLKLKYLKVAIEEIERIGNQKYICVESYRNEQEQFNVQCWALTAETIIDKDSWLSIYQNSKYSGDFEFLYFK